MADIWRELPLDDVVRMRWWRVFREEVPQGFDAQVEWLYRWWETIDAWITTTSAASPPASEGRTGSPGRGSAGRRE
jgi:hypothetical protein